MLPYKEIIGLVYYTPAENGTGEINIVTFTRLPEDQVNGMSVAEFDPAYLVPFVEGNQSIADCYIAFDDDGKPVIKRTIRVMPDDYMISEFYQVGPYRGEETTGIVLIVDGNGTIKTGMWMDTSRLLYPHYARIQLFFTALGDPNRIIRQYDIMLGDVLTSGEYIFDAPVGFPLTDYSIWTISPGSQTPIWWTKQL